MRYIRFFRNLFNWWLHFAVKFGLTSKDPLIFRTWNNIIIEVPRRLLHEFKEIFMEDSYMRGMGLRLPDSPTVIDIGANAGFFSLFAASRFPGAMIYSYEPIDSNFKQLERNKRLNGKIQMKCFQKAVYGHSGDISLTFDATDSFTTSATVFGRSDLRNKTIQMPCVTLPEILDEHHLKRCDLVKIDCEGSEYSILYNCPAKYLHRITQMAIEVHSGKEADQNIDALAHYLSTNNFKTRRYLNHMLWAWHRK